MKATRQDFAAIARAIADAAPSDAANIDYKTGNESARRAIVQSLATYLRQECPSFDATRFIEACGFEYILSLRTGGPVPSNKRPS